MDIKRFSLMQFRYNPDIGWLLAFHSENGVRPSLLPTGNPQCRLQDKNGSFLSMNPTEIVNSKMNLVI